MSPTKPKVPSRLKDFLCYSCTTKKKKKKSNEPTPEPSTKPKPTSSGLKDERTQPLSIQSESPRVAESTTPVQVHPPRPSLKTQHQDGSQRSVCFSTDDSNYGTDSDEEDDQKANLVERLESEISDFFHTDGDDEEDEHSNRLSANVEISRGLSTSFSLTDLSEDVERTKSSYNFDSESSVSSEGSSKTSHSLNIQEHCERDRADTTVSSISFNDQDEGNEDPVQIPVIVISEPEAIEAVDVNADDNYSSYAIDSESSSVSEESVDVEAGDSSLDDDAVDADDTSHKVGQDELQSSCNNNKSNRNPVLKTQMVIDVGPKEENADGLVNVKSQELETKYEGHGNETKREPERRHEHIKDSVRHEVLEDMRSTELPRKEVSNNQLNDEEEIAEDIVSEVHEVVTQSVASGSYAQSISKGRVPKKNKENTESVSLHTQYTDLVQTADTENEQEHDRTVENSQNEINEITYGKATNEEKNNDCTQQLEAKPSATRGQSPQTPVRKYKKRNEKSSLEDASCLEEAQNKTAVGGIPKAATEEECTTDLSKNTTTPSSTSTNNKETESTKEAIAPAKHDNNHVSKENSNKTADEEVGTVDATGGENQANNVTDITEEDKKEDVIKQQVVTPMEVAVNMQEKTNCIETNACPTTLPQNGGSVKEAVEHHNTIITNTGDTVDNNYAQEQTAVAKFPHKKASKNNSLTKTEIHAEQSESTTAQISKQPEQTQAKENADDKSVQAKRKTSDKQSPQKKSSRETADIKSEQSRENTVEQQKTRTNTSTDNKTVNHVNGAVQMYKSSSQDSDVSATQIMNTNESEKKSQKVSDKVKKKKNKKHQDKVSEDKMTSDQTTCSPASDTILEEQTKAAASNSDGENTMEAASETSKTSEHKKPMSDASCTTISKQNNKTHEQSLKAVVNGDVENSNHLKSTEDSPSSQDSIKIPKNKTNNKRTPESKATNKKQSISAEEKGKKGKKDVGMVDTEKEMIVSPEENASTKNKQPLIPADKEQLVEDIEVTDKDIKVNGTSEQTPQVKKRKTSKNKDKKSKLLERNKADVSGNDDESEEKIQENCDFKEESDQKVEADDILHHQSQASSSRKMAVPVTILTLAMGIVCIAWLVYLNKTASVFS